MLRDTIAQTRKWRWVLPPVTAGTIVILAGAWTGHLAVPDVAGDMQRAIEAQINDEDARVCEHLGFPAGTTQYTTCQLDLLDLRRSDRELRASDEF